MGIDPKIEGNRRAHLGMLAQAAQVVAEHLHAVGVLAARIVLLEKLDRLVDRIADLLILLGRAVGFARRHTFKSLAEVLAVGLAHE